MRRRLLWIAIGTFALAACSGNASTTTTTQVFGTAAPPTTAEADLPVLEIVDASLHVNLFVESAGEPSYSFEVQLTAIGDSEPDPGAFNLIVDGETLVVTEFGLASQEDGTTWMVELVGDYASTPLLGVYAVTAAEFSFEIGTLGDVPVGAPVLMDPADGDRLTSVPDFVWTQHVASYSGTNVPAVEYELSIDPDGGEPAFYHPIPADVTSVAAVDPGWQGLELPLGIGDYTATIRSAHHVADRITFEHHGISRFSIVPDPCVAPTSMSGGVQVSDFEQGIRPRAVACGPTGVWVHTPDAVLYGPSGPAGTIPDIGEPAGNSEVVIFHTFNTVDFITADERTPQRILERSDEEFIVEAVPFGPDRVLVSTVVEIGLFELNGTQVWTVKASGQGRFAQADDYWWAGDSDGRLYRIPVDGSEPILFEVPDTVEPVNVDRRDGLTIVPVDGGVWIDNGDDTVQFVSNAGELGETVSVGPLFVDDGFHFVRARDMWVADGVLHVADNNQDVWAVPLDDPASGARVDRAPFAEVAGLLWYLEGGLVVAEDPDGSQVFAGGVAIGDLWDWTWGHGALWLTDQFGWVTRIAVG